MIEWANIPKKFFFFFIFRGKNMIFNYVEYAETQFLAKLFPFFAELEIVPIRNKTAVESVAKNWTKHFKFSTTVYENIITIIVRKINLSLNEVLKCQTNFEAFPQFPRMIFLVQSKCRSIILSKNVLDFSLTFERARVSSRVSSDNHILFLPIWRSLSNSFRYYFLNS